MKEHPSLLDTLDQVRYDGVACLAAIIQKPGPGVHVRVRHAQVLEGVGLEGDHRKKDWWKGKRIPEREITAISREILDVIGASVEVPGDNLILEGVDLRQLQEGSLIQIGSSVILKRARKLHRPCGLFAERISEEARQAVSELQLRGALFSVVRGGMITQGDSVHTMENQ
jgi:MOSC domain-containing protein YiiM